MMSLNCVLEDSKELPGGEVLLQARVPRRHINRFSSIRNSLCKANNMSNSLNLKIRRIKPAKRYWDHARYEINWGQLVQESSGDPSNSMAQNRSTSSSRQENMLALYDTSSSMDTTLLESEGYIPISLDDERKASSSNTRLQSYPSSEFHTGSTSSIRRSEHSFRKNVPLHRSPSIEALENATALMTQLTMAINVPIEDDEIIEPFERFTELPYE